MVTKMDVDISGNHETRYVGLNKINVNAYRLYLFYGLNFEPTCSYSFLSVD